MISNIRIKRSGIQHRPVLVEVTDVLCILEWILCQQFLMDFNSKARLCGHLEAAIRDFQVQIEDIRSIQDAGPKLQAERSYEQQRKPACWPRVAIGPFGLWGANMMW